MASHATSMPNGIGSVVVDPAFWGHDLSDSSSMSMSISMGYHFSPTTSNTTQESLPGNTPPAQTPRSDHSAPNGMASQASQTSQQQAQAARTSVAVACQTCRSRHLKCDGGVRCSRCRADGVECSYIKSRRGWKGKKKPKAGENGSPTGSVPGQINQINGNGTILQSPTHNNLGAIHAYPPYIPNGNSPGSVPSVQSLSPIAGHGQPLQYNLDGSQRAAQNGTNKPQDAISSFYFYFYNAHPFCLPRPQLEQLFKERRAPLLEFAVQYMGSCYVPNLPTELYEQALERSIQSQNYPHDGFSLQALLLFAIGLHANNKVPRSAQVFSIAQQLTLDLGVHRPEFAEMNGHHDRVLEECWRRTWWSMYVVNGMLCAVNPGVEFTLKDFPLDVPLPCDDAKYFSGHIPYPHTITDFDDDTFSGPEATTFSSFTYLIDAIRCLGKVFEVERLASTFPKVVDVVDGYLCSWRNNLPACKLECVSNDGTIDEVLFQAHMVNNGATIMLHRPRSNLSFGAVENVNLCVQPGETVLPTQSPAIHTSKCRVAAENISSLIKLPGQLVHHTPFFTCVVVMASVVHLSYWSFYTPDGQDDGIKQSIRLDVGTLQQYGHTWDIAKVVLGQVRGVAHTLWGSKKAMSIHLWSNIADDDVIRGVIEDGRMEPLQNYQRLLAPMLRS